MTKLRLLNQDGLAEFQRYLTGLRNGHMKEPPFDLLDNPATSEELLPLIDIEYRDFATRYELGCYLVDKLSVLDQHEISHDSGVWSWIALWLFDQLCPSDKDGHRKPREDYHYVLSRDYRHHARHAIRTTYQFVRRYGSEVVFMFSQSLEKRGEIVEQLVARQELAAAPGVVQAASILYNDPDRHSFKIGSAGSGRGSVRRFVRVLQQFQLTYDLFSISGKDLVVLLPNEFDRFRPA